jgi:ketosteroid isomerase-like protein
MLRTVFTLVAIAVLLPHPARAQEWTAAQQEVWAFEEACWATQDPEAFMPCYADDFLGWGVGSTVPTRKADRRAFNARNFETEDIVFVHLQPLDVKVYDDIATVLYVATLTTKNKASGEETTVTQRWIDVCLKEDDRWAWIADHGVLISEN